MNKDKYIADVLRNIDADKKTLNRIKEDLSQRIEIAEENDPFFDVMEEVGHPLEVAREFNENLEIPEHYPVTIGFSYRLKIYEYKSKKTVFGVPLVHINMGGRYQTRKAKGIVAIGDVAVGVISVGGVAVGGVAIGGIGIGLLSLGGVALGGIALGGVAIGVIALGAVAIGFAKVFGALMYLLK